MVWFDRLFEVAGEGLIEFAPSVFESKLLVQLRPHAGLDELEAQRLWTVGIVQGFGARKNTWLVCTSGHRARFVHQICESKSHTALCSCIVAVGLHKLNLRVVCSLSVG